MDRQQEHNSTQNGRLKDCIATDCEGDKYSHFLLHFQARYQPRYVPKGS